MVKSSFFIIAGEASGDEYGSDLVRAMKALNPDISFYGFGGPKMLNAGVRIFRSLDKLSIVGLVEVLSKIRTIRKNFSIAKKEIRKIQPCALILIDYPGFNLRMAKWAKRQGIKVFYYVAPQTWAWKASRNRLIKKYVDQLYVILPFEQSYFQEQGIDAHFVGHPLLDKLAPLLKEKEDELAINTGNERKSIAILPGSREGELMRTIPVLLKIVHQMPEFNFVVAAMNSLPSKLYAPFEEMPNVRVTFDDTLNILMKADLGLIKSGTSTLQAALLKLPQIVYYRVNPLTFWLGKRLVKVKFMALPNIIMNKEIVKELLQNEFNPVNVNNCLTLLARKENLIKQRKAFMQMEKKLKKETNTAQVLAKSILNAVDLF